MLFQNRVYYKLQTKNIIFCVLTPVISEKEVKRGLISKMFSFLALLLGLLAPKTFEINWLSNLSTLRAPDECYSRIASCTLNLISMFLLTVSFLLQFWLLFQ
jgi:hypothetical protein